MSELILLGIGLMVVAVLVVAAIPSVLGIIRAARRWSQNRSAPELQTEARVVDKRTQLTRSGSNAEQRYYVTFQRSSTGRTG